MLRSGEGVHPSVHARITTLGDRLRILTQNKPTHFQTVDLVPVSTYSIEGLPSEIKEFIIEKIHAPNKTISARPIKEGFELDVFDAQRLMGLVRITEYLDHLNVLMETTVGEKLQVDQARKQQVGESVLLFTETRLKENGK